MLQVRLILAGMIVIGTIIWCQGIDILGYNMESVPDAQHPGGKKLSITQGRNGYDTTSCIHIPDSLGPVKSIGQLDFCLQMYDTNDCNGNVDFYISPADSNNFNNLTALAKNPPKSFKYCVITEEEARAVGPCNQAGCRRGLYYNTPEYNFWLTLFHAMRRIDWVNAFQQRASQSAFIAWDFLYDPNTRRVLGYFIPFSYIFPSAPPVQYRDILHWTITVVQQGYVPYGTLQNLQQLAVAVLNARNNDNARYPYNPQSRVWQSHQDIARFWSLVVQALTVAINTVGPGSGGG